MGLLSGLGKIAAGIGGVAAAPFTGGASLMAMLPAIAGGGASILSGIGDVTSKAAKGSSDQRIAEGNQQLGYANLAQGVARDKFLSDLQGANAQFGAGMQGAQFAREGQDRERKQALLSSLLGGLQDFNATPGNPAVAARMPKVTGGLRPSAITGNKEALLALLSQPEIQAPTYTAPSPYVAPALPSMPQAGAMEKILGGVGLGGSILGALGGLNRSVGGPDVQNKTPVPPNLAFLPESPDLLLPSRRAV